MALAPRLILVASLASGCAMGIGSDDESTEAIDSGIEKTFDEGPFDDEDAPAADVLAPAMDARPVDGASPVVDATSPTDDPPPPVTDAPAVVDAGFDIGFDTGPACPAPRAECGGSCVDVTTSALHCGRCDNPCGTDAVCAAGRCVLLCETPRVACVGQCVDTGSDVANCGACGTRCGPDDRCISGMCVSPAPTGPDPGRQCATDAECGPGDCIMADTGWPGGYCTNPCRTNGDCGPSGVCYVEGGIAACLRGCTASGGCRDGYFCAPLSSAAGICVPRCTRNPAVRCGAFACNPSTEQCVPSCASSASCSAGSTCSRSACFCGAGTDCGANRRCIGGRCGCANDAACAPFGRCNVADGSCG